LRVFSDEEATLISNVVMLIVKEAKKDVEKVMSEFPNMSAWNNPEIGYKMYVAELEDWFKNKLKPVVDRWFS